MADILVTSAVFAALLLSLTGAGADVVTWRKCKEAGDDRGRLLESSPDSNATSVRLYRCNLTEVRSGDFDGLPNLTGIRLGSNSIAHVDPAAFSTVAKLRFLNLSGNDLHEVPVFDEHSFCPSLMQLDLSYNRITEINQPNTFPGCTELRELLIDHNVIEYIHPDVFRSLSNLRFLDIRNNKITSIPETLFIKNNKLDFLDLDYNKIPYLPSDFASKLRSAGASLKWFGFYDNPWNCASLLELLADVKRAGVKHMSSYTGTEPVCVYDGYYVVVAPPSPTVKFRPLRV